MQGKYLDYLKVFMNMRIWSDFFGKKYLLQIKYSESYQGYSI